VEECAARGICAVRRGAVIQGDTNGERTCAAGAAPNAPCGSLADAAETLSGYDAAGVSRDRSGRFGTSPRALHEQCIAVDPESPSGAESILAAYLAPTNDRYRGTCAGDV